MHVFFFDFAATSSRVSLSPSLLTVPVIVISIDIREKMLK
jgi:hypothetical protein